VQQKLGSVSEVCSLSGSANWAFAVLQMHPDDVPFWLKHIGAIMAGVTVLMFAGMFTFIYFTEKSDKEQALKAAKAAKKD
jgi:hypothetical protein